METLKLIFLGMALGVDAFSVATALGTRGFKAGQVLKISLVIGFFHILMSLVGLNLGYLANYIFASQLNLNQLILDRLTTLLGSSLLIVLGVVMIYQSLTEHEAVAAELKNWSLTGWGLLILALSVSIDALSIGFGLAMLAVNFVLACFLFGIISALLVALGLLLGKKVSSFLGEYSEVFGGGILISIGIYFLLTI
ncbi:manganese efflux pump MntP [Fuchsiella alkaliacetigena]|uniref:manganese efflux pump MntP n=1 Tax=Fuchsiella alkaliacetigena TaxID=957042 RepID=UPI00200B06F4|nr:manganese efflux pump [Fuchsiella alkaliacetigena]MCK8824597.1 manganese efflux pump MntP family protein [Fuchsiella alkaliacetigena]